MALIKCSECGREVSDKAGSCPGCGAPISTKATAAAAPAKKKTGCLTWIITGILGLAILSALIGQYSDDSTSSGTSAVSRPPAPAPKPAIDKSPDKQNGREKLIADLQQRGVFGKIECRDTGATAVVGSTFYPLDFETKQSFIGVVYAFCFDGTKDYVAITLRDISTNNKVGEFSKEFGLKLN